MTAKNHGARQRYGAGCRCDDCKHAQALYQRNYGERRANGLTRPAAVVPQVRNDYEPEVGPVESAVEAEISGLAQAQLRPGLVAIAAAMARILDNSRAPRAQPAAAKVLVSVLETLHKGSAQGRRGNLAVVCEMTTKDGT
jgi:hypothetical protein